jgi:site-specific recombinase
MRQDLVLKLEEFVMSRDFVNALTETGLTLESGVFSEIFKRLEYKILPKPVQGSDILSFLSRVFDAQSDAAWLERINRARFGELISLLLPNKNKLIESLAPQIFMSLEILSLRLGGLGYDPIINQRLHTRREYQHAFMDVTRQVHALLDGKGEEALPAIREALQRCANSVVWIRSRRGTDGVSLALTYRLMRIQQIIQRMELVLELVESILIEWREEPGLELFFEIMMAEIRRFNLSRFFSENISLLAYQITEHTGKAGEHYITRTRVEWRLMFKSAALGGAVVGVLSILKFLIARLHMPPAPEALGFSILYSVGFLVILAVGGTLATKQPAMTAATLASSMDEAENSEQAMSGLAEIIVRTIRSQMIALAGNYLIAFPVAAFFCLPFNMMNHPIMSHEKAWAVIEGFHPLKTLAFFYAALAGVGLFASGLLAGYADNWFVFNHVGERLKNSEVLRRWVSAHNLESVIHSIDHNLGFWVGNVSLGFYLGSMTSAGIIFGLPLACNHITFSSGQFGVAMATLNFQVPASTVALTAFSVFCFGLINLGVSFSLSLFVAIRSRQVRFSQTPELLRLLGRKFLHRPFEFVFPPRDAA